MSLRARLALFIGAAIAIALLVQGVTGYVVFRQQAYAALDRDVELVLESVEQEVFRTAGPRGAFRRVVPLAALPEDYVARARLVYQGEIVASSQGFPDGVPTEPGGSPDTYGVWRVGSSSPVQRAPGLVLQAAVSSREVSAGLQRYRRTLIGTVLGVSALGALIALVVSRPALRPLHHLLGTARRVAGSGDLSLRVPPGGAGELGQMSQTFNHMLERLEAFREREGAFTRSASHELRTPLAAMKLHLSSHRAGYMATDETLRALEVEVDRMTRLSESLLLLAREGRARREPLDLAALAREAADAFGASYRGPRSLALAGDPALLRHAVGNLLDNACKHAPGACVEVKLSAQPDEPWVVVRVVDDGPGLPDAALARAGEPFYRAPGATAAGTGLGLTVAAQVAEAHGGRLELRAAHPHGLCVELRLAVDAS